MFYAELTPNPSLEKREEQHSASQFASSGGLKPLFFKRGVGVSSIKYF
jgi:hypothetical protein